MEQYISKSALVAEIKRILSAFENSDAPVDRLRASILIGLLSFINTFEVKEVDLEKEFDDYIEKQNAFTNNDNSEIEYYNGDSFNHVYDIYPIAKHFFELGMAAGNKAQKGEEVCQTKRK